MVIMISLSNLVVVTTIAIPLDAKEPGRIRALIFWESELAVPERGMEEEGPTRPASGNRRELPPERAETAPSHCPL
jgi:hypothetical protein